LTPSSGSSAARRSSELVCCCDDREDAPGARPQIRNRGADFRPPMSAGRRQISTGRDGFRAVWRVRLVRPVVIEPLRQPSRAAPAYDGGEPFTRLAP
jgi:hypothetical protein